MYSKLIVIDLNDNFDRKDFCAIIGCLTMFSNDWNDVSYVYDDWRRIVIQFSTRNYCKIDEILELINRQFSELNLDIVVSL